MYVPWTAGLGALWTVDLGMMATREKLETPSLWSGETSVVVAQSADLDRLALSVSGRERSAWTRAPVERDRSGVSGLVYLCAAAFPPRLPARSWRMNA